MIFIFMHIFLHARKKINNITLNKFHNMKELLIFIIYRL